MIRFMLVLFALALAQTVLTIGLTVIAFSSEMSRFDNGAPASAVAQIASALAGAFAYPILPLVALLPLAMQPSGFPAEHFVFLANGVIWAAGILMLRRLWVRRRVRRS